MPELPPRSDSPWENEPDERRWNHAGLVCWARRGPAGHWCGYVGVASDHVAHGVGYDDLEVEVHGGLTWAGEWKDGGDGLWWLGFDCGHYMDFVPRSSVTTDGQTYKDLAYVSRETEELAKQLAAPLKIRRWRLEGTDA